jgi:hypothetical protein
LEAAAGTSFLKKSRKPLIPEEFVAVQARCFNSQSFFASFCSQKEVLASCTIEIIPARKMNDPSTLYYELRGAIQVRRPLGLNLDCFPPAFAGGAMTGLVG